MGALYLKPLDDRMARLGRFYVRYMDDWGARPHPLEIAGCDSGGE
jgi:hypothetical protein